MDDYTNKTEIFVKQKFSEIKYKKSKLLSQNRSILTKLNESCNE